MSKVNGSVVGAALLGTGCSLTAAAYAAERESVRSSRDGVKTERMVRRSMNQLRLASMEAGRRELLEAAGKMLVGGIGAAVMQAGAAACQWMAAARMPAHGSGVTQATRYWDARAQVFQVGASVANVYSQASGFDQADKALFDREAEIYQWRAQEADQRAAEARGMSERELGRMKDLLEAAHHAALAAVRA